MKWISIKERVRTRPDGIENYFPEYKTKGNIHISRREFLSSMSDLYYNIGLDFAINENKPIEAKQNFYMSSKFTELEFKLFPEKINGMNGRDFYCFLFTDNWNLINKFCEISIEPIMPMILNGQRTRFYLIQTFLNEDWVFLDRLFEIMETKCSKKHVYWELEVNFFKCLKLKDKAGCENILKEFLTPKVHKKFNFNTTEEEFISYPAASYAKLAWLKGVEVDIDHPFVPKCLLPVKPNEIYIDEYDYLKDI